MHTDSAFLRVSRNTYVLASLFPDREEWVEDVSTWSSEGGLLGPAKEWRRPEGNILHMPSALLAHAGPPTQRVVCFSVDSSVTGVLCQLAHRLRSRPC